MTITFLDVIAYGFAGSVTWICGRRIVTGEWKEDFEVFKGARAGQWASSLIGAAVCGAMIWGALLAAAKMPDWVSWSWLSLVASKGESAQGTNLNLAGVNIPYFGPFFLLLIFINLPAFARAEEEMFRHGTKNWFQAVPRSVAFGMSHMLVGVPLWAGAVLTIPGLWFTDQFFRGGIRQSTMAHTVYNMILVAGLAVWLYQGRL